MPRFSAAGLLLLLVLHPGSAAPEAPQVRLGCWFVEEAPGAVGSVMPGKLNQHRALLLLPSPARRTSRDDRDASTLPPDVAPGRAFRVFDPSGALWGGGDPSVAPFWLGADASEAEPPVSCEINAYQLHDAHVAWAAGLGQEGCPRALEGQWFIVGLQNADAGFGVSSILHKEEHFADAHDDSGITTASAVFSVFSRTPFLQAQMGQDVVLDCGFSAPAGDFSVEWRHQHHGAGRVILAYDGVAKRISVAEEGAVLFLEAGSSNVSLHIQRAGVRHEGTYICTVYVPHLQAQQAMELKIVAPPKVVLHPAQLSVAPGAHAELVCELSGYFPLEASIKWTQQRPGGDPKEDFLDVRESGHRQLPDGTYSFTSIARLLDAQPEDHGTAYTCHAVHVGLGEAGQKRTVVLHVAGSLGPSLEDAIGLFLAAFVLVGLLQAVSRHAFGAKPKSQADGHNDQQRTSSAVDRYYRQTSKKVSDSSPEAQSELQKVE